VEFVEPVFAAGQREDDAIIRHGLGELGVVVAAGFGAVAAADEEEVFDGTGLDAFDDFVGDAEDGVVAESDGDGVAGAVGGEAFGFLGGFDDRLEVAVGDVLDTGPGDEAAGEESAFVAVLRLLNAVGRHEDGTGEGVKLNFLVLPRAAVVAGKMFVFFERGVAVAGEHLAVGIDVDAGTFGLL